MNFNDYINLLDDPTDERKDLIAEAIGDLTDNEILDLAKDRLPHTISKLIDSLRADLTELFIYDDEFPHSRPRRKGVK